MSYLPAMSAALGAVALIMVVHLWHRKNTAHLEDELTQLRGLVERLLVGAKTKKLALSRKEIDDSLCAQLHTHLPAECASIHVLEVSHNFISDRGVKALLSTLQLASLKTLWLDYNAIGLGGAEIIRDWLASHNSLKTLGLGYNRLGNAGACAIFEALEKPSTRLEELRLNSNAIGHVAIAKLTPILQVNQRLRKLFLERNEISERDQTALRNAATGLALSLNEQKHDTVMVRRALLFVCSPTISPLPNAVVESFEIADILNLMARDVCFGGFAETLRQRLAEKPTKIFVFSGHGDADAPPPKHTKTLGFTPDIATSKMQKGAGKLDIVHPEDIAAVLGTASKKRLELVFLNACCTQSLAQSITDAGVATVVCWRTRCQDGAARYFAEKFFRSLGDGDGYHEAFEQAVLALRLGRETPEGDKIMYRLCGPDEETSSLPGTVAAGEPVLMERSSDPYYGSMVP